MLTFPDCRRRGAGNETPHPSKKPKGENEFIYLIYAHFHFSTVYESLLQFALICGHVSFLFFAFTAACSERVDPEGEAFNLPHLWSRGLGRG